MKTLYLFPARFRTAGWILLILGLLTGIVLLAEDRLADQALSSVFALWDADPFADQHYFAIRKNNIVDEIVVLLICIGGVLAGFSKMKDEDEFIATIRYESLVWAMYLNVGFLMFTTLFFYGYAYWYVMLINLIAMLVFFVIRFHYKLAQLRKSLRDEE